MANRVGEWVGPNDRPVQVYNGFESFQQMCQELGVTAQEAANLSHAFTIGDNPKSDVEGTNNFKSYNNVVWFSILVETGVWKQGQPVGFPDWVVSDVKTAVNEAMRIKNLPTMPE